MSIAVSCGIRPSHTKLAFQLPAGYPEELRVQLRLTDHSIKKLPAPPTGRIEVADTLLPGLTLRVTEHGSKTWTLLYRVAGERNGRLKGKLRRMTIGPYPLNTLEDARRKAREALQKADQGVDPVEEREARLHGLNATAFEAVFERFIALYAKPNVETWVNIERLLAQHVVPVWKTRQISSIGRAAVHELLDDLIQRVSVGRAREVRKHLSKMFNWAVDRGMLAASPIAGMRRPELAYVARERVLAMDELKRVWEGAAQLSYPFGTLVQLLILTGQRRAEIANAKRSWLLAEIRAIEIPASHYKSDRPQVVPLSPTALSIIEKLPLWNGGDHLLSTTGGHRPISGFSKAKAQLDALCGIDDWTLHDLRRSAATHMARLGVPQEHIERVLGHAIEGVAGTYNRYSYLEEKRAALVRWGNEWSD